MVETRRRNGSYVAFNKGRHHTDEAKEKNRLAHLGKVPWNKGKIGIMPIPWNKGGGNYTPEMIKNISEAHKGKMGKNHLIGKVE